MTPIHKRENVTISLQSISLQTEETLGQEYDTHPHDHSKGVTFPGRLYQQGWADRSKVRMIFVEVYREVLCLVFARPLADQIVHIPVVLVIAHHGGFQDGVGVTPSFVDPRRVLYAQLFEQFFECVRLADWDRFV